MSHLPGRVYLDTASCWPLRPEAARALDDARRTAWADPSRRHAEARAARSLLDQATATAARRIGAAAGDLVWTSGGTEAAHLAVLGIAAAAERRGARRRHVLVSAVEHSAVLAACERLADRGYEVQRLPVDRAGRVDPDLVAGRLRDDTLAVHLQHANHELGTLQPTHDVAAACRRRGALLHVDACQTVGQLGVTLEQVGADLLSASAAKFGGPPGVGFLALGPRGRVDALLGGDDRQRRRRAGRVDVPAVAAAAVALEVAASSADAERSSREAVRRRLRERLPETVPDLEVHGPLAEAHPGIVACSALYVEGETLVAELDAAGFAVHSGSSCATDSGAPSHVLVAAGALTHGHVRASFGPEVTLADADAFVDALAETVDRLRRLAGVG